MKKWALYLIFTLFSNINYANAKPTRITLGGHFFADLYTELHKTGITGAKGKRTAFSVERFRLNLKAEISEKWQFVSRIQMKNGQDAFLRSAYVRAKNIFVSQDMLMAGTFSNFYKYYIYRHTSTRWLNKLGLHDIEQDYNLNGESAALRYVYMPENFKFGIDLINGEESSKTDTAASAENTNNKIAYALYLSHKIGVQTFHLFYTATPKSTYQNGSNFNSSIPARNTTAFDYTLNMGMLDLIAEYDLHSDGAGHKPSRIHFTADFSYAENQSFFVSFNKDDDDEAGDQSESKVFGYILGPVLKLENGLKTAVSYRFQSYELSSEADEKTLAWNFEAKF